MKDNWVYSKTLDELINLTGAFKIETFSNFPPQVGEGVRITYFSEEQDIYNRNQKQLYCRNLETAKEVLKEIKESLGIKEKEDALKYCKECDSYSVGEKGIDFECGCGEAMTELSMEKILTKLKEELR